MDKTNRMKKTIYYILILLVANFTSCTGNDVVDQSITEEDLWGSWEVSELYTENGYYRSIL